MCDCWSMCKHTVAGAATAASTCMCWCRKQLSSVVAGKPGGGCLAVESMPDLARLCCCCCCCFFYSLLRSLLPGAAA
jgi:hypothetical protein